MNHERIAVVCSHGIDHPVRKILQNHTGRRHVGAGGVLALGQLLEKCVLRIDLLTVADAASRAAPAFVTLKLVIALLLAVLVSPAPRTCATSSTIPSPVGWMVTFSC